MKTLADFKKAMALGTTWKHCAYEWQGKPHLAGNEVLARGPVTREVGLVQTNCVAFKSNDPNRPNMSWLYWPKSAEVRFVNHDDGRQVVVIQNGDHGFLTYEKVSK